jgi:hypothetical protein
MTRTALAVFATLVLAGTAAFGHHAYTGFVLDRDATITGTIEGIRFQNPHVLIVVRTEDAGRLTAEWRGANWLQSHPELVSPNRVPVTSATLKPGDRIVVTGAPPRDRALRSLVNLKEIRRPSDGWLWTCRRSEMNGACS